MVVEVSAIIIRNSLISSRRSGSQASFRVQSPRFGCGLFCLKKNASNGVHPSEPCGDVLIAYVTLLRYLGQVASAPWQRSDRPFFKG